MPDVDFPLLHIKLKEDYSVRLGLLHYVAFDGVILWPERRKGERIREEAE